MTRRRWLAGVALTALLLAGCGGGGGVDGVDADALLEAAAQRMDAVEAFHFLLTQENGTTGILLGLQLVSAEGDIAGPDRAQLEVKAKLGTTNIAMKIMVLPDASYITNPITGRWQEEAVSISAFFNPDTGVTALMRAVTDAKATRRERMGGVDTYRVEAMVDSGDLDLFAADAPPGRALKARAWIGVDDPLVYRVEIEGSVTPDEPDNVLRRLDLSRFDQPVEITAPR